MSGWSDASVAVVGRAAVRRAGVGSAAGAVELRLGWADSGRLGFEVARVGEDGRAVPGTPADGLFDGRETTAERFLLALFDALVGQLDPD